MRQGRLSKGQRRALDELYPRYALSDEQWSQPQFGFPRLQPLTLEIGFGMGDSLVQMAVDAPEQNFLGAEVHGPGVGHLMLKAEQLALTNIKVINGDAWSVLPELPDNCLSVLQVFFPDPWHKKKHHKRRLVNQEFLDCVADKLMLGGCLHLATDWVPYAEVMQEALQTHPAFEFSDPPRRPITKYEQRGLRLGHEVTDIAVRTRR